MARRLTKQEMASAEKKKLIFDIAIKLFEENGYDQTTVRQICQEAGITTGSFYHFFQDKLGIIRQLYVEILEKGRKELECTPEHLEHPFQSILNYLVVSTSVLQNFNKDFSQNILMETTRMMNGSYDAAYENTNEGILHVFLSEAQKYGTVTSDLDIAKTISYIMAVSIGCVQYWLLRSPNMTFQDVIDQILIPSFSPITDEMLVFKVVTVTTSG